MQTQDNTEMCYRRGNQRTRQKTSPQPSKSKSIHQRIKLEYMNNKRPSKSSLLRVLKPYKLLLPTDFSESCLLQLSGSRNTPDCIRQASPASFGKIPKTSQAPKHFLHSEKVWVVFTNLLSRYNNRRGKEKRLQ